MATKRPVFLSIREVAALMQVDTSTLWRWRKRGDFPNPRIGNRYLASDVEAFLNRKTRRTA